MDTPLVATYVAYAAVAVPLVVWLSRTLTANGATFLHDVFRDREDLADAINRLLAIGFLLLNLGYALLLLLTDNDGVATTLDAVELLVTKLGTLLLSLGVIHFVNMVVFWRIRQRSLDDQRPPAAPTVVGPPPPPAPRPATGTA